MEGDDHMLSTVSEMEEGNDEEGSSTGANTGSDKKTQLTPLQRMEAEYKRKVGACLQCREDLLVCDSRSPCRNCEKAGHDCVYRSNNLCRCPLPGCRMWYEDLTAHKVRYHPERPEKCPIPTCEYHTKGFARKHDRERHTLMHYKGTILCDFCSGVGSAAGKRYNRIDVLKRHSTSVHRVEQVPTYFRREPPPQFIKQYQRSANPGTCSICNCIFVNAQELYDHLDACALRAIEQTKSQDAINERHPSSIKGDDDVVPTFAIATED
ncbi:hypothetical protein EV356DRAFT_514710 [Viridothelium virens]|uniref:Zn(2)-C6 fungal-type domain-containing protein n=1 Tax=Viridothelium virens TaxID=1048519 RepID=A0A6A6HC90_VIRVR|nr:hypothetical protein EV356DRAFT_514710 [Viridothelium virens]